MSRQPVGLEELEALRHIDLFAGLTEQQIARLVAACDRAHFPAGSVIVQEGAEGHCMYILIEGEVEISKTMTLRLSPGEVGQREKSLTRLKAGNNAFFGEMALVEGGERSATAVAARSCSILCMARDSFERLVAEDPSLGYLVLRNILKVLTLRLRRANEDIVKLTTALSLALGNR